MSKNINDLAEKLGLTFNDINLLKTALTHRSFLNEDKTVKESNERLEFLGDSVLSVLTSTKLYFSFPNSPEGNLTTMRSALVKTKTLAQVSIEVGLGEYLLMSKGEEREEGRKNQSLLADCFEAVLGAIYLDLGIDEARNFLEKWLFPKIKEIETTDMLEDFKSKLQELTQKQFKNSPSYELVSASGPDHNKIFTMKVVLNNKSLGEGSGKNKQTAEQMAAKVALENLTVK